LAAGFCPDPLGELMRRPDSLATMGTYFQGDGRERREERGDGK